jgi:hypothetical protein
MENPDLEQVTPYGHSLKRPRQQEIFIDEQVFENELEDENKVSIDFKPIQPDDVISDVELGASPIAKEETAFNEDQGQMK